ncbi:MAG: polysaccharide deacetylase [Ramlibacter sp.]|nr:polysaccharide deacetylase [Ramlibacter sp.]
MSTPITETEHRHFPYSAVPGRERLVWPGNARIAVPVFLHFECMDFDAAPATVQDTRWKERRQPDVRLYTWHEYGNRVAIFRVLDLLDRHGLRVTVAANALACERYPFLVKAFLERGYEIAAHGIAANRMISSAMPEDEEHAFIQETLARIHQACGVRPVGWISQDHGESRRTPAHLAQLGIRYVADWPNDDQPYRMPGAGGLVSLPAAGEWDDLKLLWDRRLQAWRFPEMINDALDQLDAEGAGTGRYFALSLHPWLIGAPHRITYLEQTLKALSARRAIWNAAAGDIASHAFPPDQSQIP